jgi:hypothetical protein
LVVLERNLENAVGPSPGFQSRQVLPAKNLLVVIVVSTPATSAVMADMAHNFLAAMLSPLSAPLIPSTLATVLMVLRCRSFPGYSATISIQRKNYLASTEHNNKS